MYCFCSYCDSAIVRNVLRVYRNDMLIASPPPFLPQMHTNTNGIPSSAGDHPHYAPGWTFQKPKTHMCKHTCGGKILWTNSPHCKHTVVDTATGNRLTEMLLCLEDKQTETTHPQQFLWQLLHGALKIHYRSHHVGDGKAPTNTVV